MTVVSARARAADDAFAKVRDFLEESQKRQYRPDPDAADFTFGNPHELPLEGLVKALRERAVPHDANWFSYKASEEAPQEFVADRLSGELELSFEPPDIALTAGAFAAINVAMHLVLDAGDEAIISEPAWFCYEPMLLSANAIPRKIRLAAHTFDLDLAAIDAAIGPKTRMVIVNSPHNPTGRIYGRELLADLADLLERASARIGRRIFLLSDEPYRRLRFDDRGFTSPAAVYPWTLISYSYGKVLLAPGQRLGYLALSPLMPDRDRQALRDALLSTQMALGWCFPSALMQYAVLDLESLRIDHSALTRRRDRFLAALGSTGYAMLPPEGTFYLFGKWPAGDPERLWNALADRKVFVMPGSLLGAPECFRISLTASDEMIDRALPAFLEILG